MTASTLIEPGTVKLERLLPGPVERVWAYLTESDNPASSPCASSPTPWTGAATPR